MLDTSCRYNGHRAPYLKNEIVVVIKFPYTLLVYTKKHMSITLLKSDELEQLKSFYLNSILSHESSSVVLGDLLEEALHLEGSLVRAQICLASFLSRGGSKDFGLKLACGVEYFHLASLLLDDLPCMDNATQRRGHQCMHLKYGEANTILAALSLINRSYTLFYSVICQLDKKTQEKCTKLLDTSLGLDGIVAGQALDIAFRYGTKKDKLDIRKIAMLKTASLFSLCIILPALATGANDVEIKHLNRFSHFSGLAYQIFDDFKDVRMLEGLSIKTPRDEELSRPNIVLALGVEPASVYLDRIVKNISKSIHKARMNSLSYTNVYETISKYFDNKLNVLKSYQSFNAVNIDSSAIDSPVNAI